MRVGKGLLLTLVLLLAAWSAGCNKLKARDQLNKGVNSFRNGQFAQSIDHFQQAVTLDPTLINARLYLATAYAQQYVPGGDSKQNIQFGQQAIKAFEDVLSVEPNNISALASISQLYFNMKQFDKAKAYQVQRLKVEPNNPEGYYWIGVLDWYPCLEKQMTLRRDLNLNTPKDPAKPDELPPLPEKARAKLAEENGPLVDEGINALQKAIELRPNYFDAMAYLNLMYRQKADIETDNDARDADLKLANEWVTKALATKKAGPQTTGPGA